MCRATTFDIVCAVMHIGSKILFPIDFHEEKFSCKTNMSLNLNIGISHEDVLLFP